MKACDFTAQLVVLVLEKADGFFQPAEPVGNLLIRRFGHAASPFPGYSIAP